MFNKFREVLVICPICVYGTLLVAWGGNMRLWCIKKKNMRYKRILGDPANYSTRIYKLCLQKGHGKHTTLTKH